MDTNDSSLREELTPKPYPAGLDAATEERIFHERMHYWQTLSTPLREVAFSQRLVQLRMGVTACVGQGGLVAGRVPPRDPAEVDRLVHDADLTFNHFGLSESMVRGMNEVNHELHTLLAFTCARRPAPDIPATRP